MNSNRYAFAFVLIAVMFAASFAVLSSETGAESNFDFTDDYFGYDLVEGTDDLIVYAKGEADYTQEILTIPSTFKNNGKTYNVIAVGNNAFPENGNGWYAKIATIEISEGIQAVGDSSFTGCVGITSVKLPESLTAIGEGSFVSSKTISEISIPANLLFMGNAPFGGCNVEKFSVASENTSFSVGDDGFLYGNGGRDLIQATSGHKDAVKIKEGVEIIRSMAFYRSDISSLTIASSVTNIDYFAFSTSKIGTISFESNSHLTSIEDYAFYVPESDSTQNRGEIAIPDSVLNVGCYSFYNNGFSKITIGNGVKWIGDHAFELCEELVTLTLGSSVEMIGVSSFGKCDKLTSITIPASVEFICDGAFYGDVATDVTVTFKGARPSMGEDAFSMCTSTIYFVTEGKWGKFSDFDYFVMSKNCTVVVDGERNEFKSTDFSDGKFKFRTNDDSTVRVIEYIGEKKDEGLYIPDSATNPSTNKTYIVTGIECRFPKEISGTLRLPESLTTIVAGNVVDPGADDNGAFRLCKDLTGTLTIPKNLYRIGTNTFDGCGFTGLTFESGSTLKYISGKAFDGLWRLTGTLRLPDSVGMIGFRSMRYLGVDNIILGDGIKVIGGEAFKGCQDLKTITFGKNLEYIGYYSLKDSGLSSNLTIPAKVKYIGTSAFASGGEMNSKIVKFEGDKPILGPSSLFFGYNNDKYELVKVVVVTNGWGESLDGRVLGIFTDVKIIDRNQGVEIPLVALLAVAASVALSAAVACALYFRK